MVEVNMDWRGYMLVAIWVETLLFGVYSSLFFETMHIAFRKREKRATSAWIFTGVTVLMYVVALMHVCVSLYRLFRGYVWVNTSYDIFMYWITITWEGIFHTVLHGVMVWLAQFLLLFRLYIIWDRNVWVALPSALMLLASIGLGTMTNVLWSIPGGIVEYSGVADALLPFSFVQHIWTTGLIAFKLIRQHYQSRALGISDSRSRLNLYEVGIIMIESAAIYSLVLIAGIVFHALNSNIKFVLFGMGIPTIGITFSLIAVRMHRMATAKEEIGTTLFTLDTRHRRSLQNTENQSDTNQDTTSDSEISRKN